MTAISTAVGLERVARAVGYAIDIGNFQTTSPNLPQRIAILGAANEAKQSTLDTTPKQLSSVKDAGDKYGYGSVFHQIMRILKPISGDGVGGIPIYAYPQADPVSATQTTKVISATLATTALANETHFVKINGRTNIDGQYYQINIVKGDTRAQIVTKIVNAINSVVGSPALASEDTSTPGSELVDLTSKVAGAISAELNVEFVTGDNNAGVTYAEDSSTDGTGDHDISDALAYFGTEWNTIVINPYGSTVFDTLETTNGDPVSRDGLFTGTVFKPFVSIWGSTESDKDTLTAITNAEARKGEVTNALAPAPNSDGYTWEAAANMAYLYAINSQQSPHLDISGKMYPDMPIPNDLDIGDMSDYDNRDEYVKKGASTVSVRSGKYQVENFITTYHPDGEITPAYRFARDLMLDFNIAFADNVLVEQSIRDKTIIGSSQVTTVQGTIKPIEAVQLTRGLIDDLALRALIVDVDFAKESIRAQVSDTNPKRLERTYRYKRSSTANIVSTTVEAGFAFGLE